MNIYKRRFRFSDKRLEYDFKLRQKFPWWLFLLLLPLLFFVPINQNVQIMTVDRDGNAIPGAHVTMEYNEHELFKKGRWNYHLSYSDNRITGAQGFADFGTIHTTLYSSLFFPHERLYFTAKFNNLSGECSLSLYRKYLRPIVIVLDRCTYRLQVKSLANGAPLEGATVNLDFSNGNSASYVTDTNGEISITSEEGDISIRYLLSKCAGYIDKHERDINFNDFLNADNAHVVWMYYKVDHVDIVLCIDGTGSMRYTLDAVKSGAIGFHPLLQKKCEEHGKMIDAVRIRLIYFGDLARDGNKALIATDFFRMPGQEKEYEAIVKGLSLCNGGDAPESGLEAVSIAIDSPWETSDGVNRQLVTVWTDAPAHPIHTVGLSNPLYPKATPTSFAELSAQWELGAKGLDGEIVRHILLVTPLKEPWNEIKESWSGAIFREYDSSTAGNVEIMLDKIADAL